MDSDMIKGLNKAIDAATGRTGTEYEYLNNTPVTEKLDELAEAIAAGGGGGGGQVNVQSDWNETDPSSDAYIKNKPTIPAALSDLTDDATHRTVTDAEKAAWNAGGSERFTALGKLTAGETTVTIYSADLTPDSTVDVYTSIDGVNYTSITLNSGSAVLIYPAQTSDMRVKLVFFNDNDPIIYDYELNNYVASSYVDTGIKLRSEANRTRDWEMLLDTTIDDTNDIYRWSFEYYSRSVLSVIHDSTSSSVIWMLNNNTISALANLTTIQIRVVKNGSNLIFYNMEDEVLYSVAWDNTLDDSSTLVVGGSKNNADRPQGGTINSFKFRWLN